MSKHRTRVGYWRYVVARSVYLLVDIVALLPLLAITVCSRFVARPIDVGIGPLPIVNSNYHKQCLIRYGYSCETYTDDAWHIIANFDVRFERLFQGGLRILKPYALYIFVLFRYRCLYVYFIGGPLRHTTLLVRLEPLLYALAGIRTVVTA